MPAKPQNLIKFYQNIMIFIKGIKKYKFFVQLSCFSISQFPKLYSIVKLTKNLSILYFEWVLNISSPFPTSSKQSSKVFLTKFCSSRPEEFFIIPSIIFLWTGSPFSSVWKIKRYTISYNSIDEVSRTRKDVKQCQLTNKIYLQQGNFTISVLYSVQAEKSDRSFIFSIIRSLLLVFPSIFYINRTFTIIGIIRN